MPRRRCARRWRRCRRGSAPCRASSPGRRAGRGHRGDCSHLARSPCAGISPPRANAVISRGNEPMNDGRSSFAASRTRSAARQGADRLSIARAFCTRAGSRGSARQLKRDRSPSPSSLLTIFVIAFVTLRREPHRRDAPPRVRSSTPRRAARASSGPSTRTFTCEACHETTAASSHPVLIALPLLRHEIEAPAATRGDAREQPSSGRHAALPDRPPARRDGGSEEIVGIPKNAEKAIRDIRDFLPFKSYRCSTPALLRLRTSGKIRLDGIPPQQYEVRVAFAALPKNKLSIWDFNVMAVACRATRRFRRASPPRRSVRSSTPRSRSTLGETIVVGSSKLGGDQALIVLFTALPNW